MALVRNAAFNLLGAAVPAILSIATMPYIVGKLGDADFGLLMLVTAIVGYFALLDINVTAGSTKYVAQYNATGDQAQVHATASFGLVVYTAIGAVGMLGLWFGADLLVTRLFSVPADRTDQAVVAVQVAALGFLLGQVQAYLQSLPGALLRYDISGRIEAVFGTLVPLLTVAVLALGHGLVVVVALRVTMSAVQTAVLCVVLRRLMPGWRFAWPAPALRRQLLGFSGYAFLSRMAALTYAHADRLLIGARVGVVALSYYAVPATLANRVMALVFRLSGVMFPHASALAAAGRTDDLRRHYLLASRYLFFLNGAIALMLSILSHPTLLLWLNPQFAVNGSAVMAMIALTIWLDSLTNAPSLVNDGLGHPKVTGAFSVARAFLGLALISIGVDALGITGAAAGHLLASVVMSTAFLVWVHDRTVPVDLKTLVREAYLIPSLALVPGAAFLFVGRQWINSWGSLIAVASVGGLLFIAMGMIFVMNLDHRSRILAKLSERAA